MDFKPGGYWYEQILKTLDDPGSVIERVEGESESEHRARAISTMLTWELLDEGKRDGEWDVDEYIQQLDDDAPNEHPVSTAYRALCWLLITPSERPGGRKSRAAAQSTP